MGAVAHWDDIAVEDERVGVIGGRWQALGEAAGAVRLGLNRLVVPAGGAGTPLHAEDEELFYVLAGSGWSVQEDGCFAIGAGDAIHYGAGWPAHTVVAGDAGLDVLAMGRDARGTDSVRFPRIGRVRAGGMLVAGETVHQYELEAQLPRIEVKDPPDPRPASIVNESEVSEEDFSGPRTRRLGRAVGARALALSLARLDPGTEGAPPHCHSMEEELFVVLEGDGVLLLGAEEEEEHPVRAGSLVGRPSGTREVHAFRAGERGMTLLMFSDTHSGDATYEPRTHTVWLRGLGVRVRAE